MSIRYKIAIIIATCALSLQITACRQPEPTATSNQPSASPSETVSVSVSPTHTAVPPTPTPTPIPLAAKVNGEAITLAEFQAELTRFQAATTITGTFFASDTNTIILNELIDQTLLNQGAEESGFSMSEADLQTRFDALENQLGSPQALEQWMVENGYTEDDLHKALRRSIGSTWMRDQIIASVPQTADQVHVMQILLTTAGEANEVHESLASGTEFLEMAETYEPLTKGDLGWFPRGYLDEPAIDEAVFALQPGEFTPVIETDIGYHILYLVEREAQRPLQPDALQKFQVEAVKAWIADRRTHSEVQVFLP